MIPGRIPGMIPGRIPGRIPERTGALGSQRGCLRKRQKKGEQEEAGAPDSPWETSENSGAGARNGPKNPFQQNPRI